MLSFRAVSVYWQEMMLTITYKYTDNIKFIYEILKTNTREL